MKPVANYISHLQEITGEFRKSLSTLTEDGVVEAHEVEIGREVVDSFKKKLKLLKKEITLDIKTIRASYKAQILAARASSDEDKTQRVHELNLQENQALTDYQQALQQIESGLIDADKTKQVFANVLEGIEQLESEPSTPSLSDDTLTLEERLLPLLTKWQALIDGAQQKLNVEHVQIHDSAQVAYWQGIKEGIDSALKDLRGVLTDDES